MEELNAEKIKKLKLGEGVGTAATVICGVITAAFAVCFSIAQVKDIHLLRMISVILFPSLLIVAVGVAAYCNLKFSVELGKIIKNHVKNQLIESAALMHPDRNALSFAISVNQTFAEIKVNNFKETVKLDFSAFNRLSIVKKSAVAEAIAERLNVTFCRLYDRGVHYSSVSYFLSKGSKNGKPVFIIENGKPDKRAYRTYLKAN